MRQTNKAVAVAREYDRRLTFGRPGPSVARQPGAPWEDLPTVNVDKHHRERVFFMRFGMEIIWSGHSCFTIRGKETTLLLDPCPPDCGCITRWGNPQAVVISHDHPGHSCISQLTGAPRVFNGPGEYEVGGAFITGIGTYHDSEQGAVRGKNTLYVIEMEGLTLCHTGDLGHPLNAPTLREIGKVDILFVPVGDVSTLSVAEARTLVKALQPRYVLPMHFRTENARPDLEPVETFLEAMSVLNPETRPKLLATATNLPMNLQVLLLNCDSRAG